MGITDPRDQLDAATTLDEIADILADALQPIITFSGGHRRDESLRSFKQRVRNVEDITELLDIAVTCNRVVEGDTKTGVAYQLTYDFPSRTSTFSEARLADGKVTFLGDPFVDGQGEEYNPLRHDV